MENANPLLVVIDAGHGGYDNGAQWEGRREKDDNLRLALLVQKDLEAQGVEVLMTRDTDVFIPLAERARMANQADADLFVSIHRNSYIEPTPTTNGIENYIYLTAPEATSGRAAQLVQDAVVSVGAQKDRGVNRGNYYVLRKTNMPSMLLEMGFILNDEDNRLFDENLEAYAQGITKGILEYFGLPYRQPGTGTPTQPPVPLPSTGGSRRDLVVRAQNALNAFFGSGLAPDGSSGPQTRRAVVRALQGLINDQNGTNLPVDGLYGPMTQAQLPTLQPGDRGNGVALLQILLTLAGYDVGTIDGVYGPRTQIAVQLFQRDNYLTPDGIAGPRTLNWLLS